MIRFYILYWTIATLLIGGMYLSAVQNVETALFLAATTLPVIILTKYLWRDISFVDKRKGVLSVCYLGTFILLIQYLALTLSLHYLLHLKTEELSGLLFNPLFLGFLFIALLSFEQWLSIRFFPSEKERQEQEIEFISDRKRITLEIDTIRIVESCDSEVWIRTTNGNSYRTKMNISQWESILDNRFIRIHRAFIINKAYITRSDSHTIYLENERFEISRKYKEKVAVTIKSDHLD